MGEFFISEAKLEHRRKEFKRELAKLRDRTDDELVGQAPTSLTKRKLVAAGIETLALWYRAAQLEMETYASWNQAKTLSNRLDRIEAEIESRLGIDLPTLLGKKTRRLNS